MAYSCNPSTLRGKFRQISEFKASLVYRVSFRTVRAIQRNTVSKNKKQKQKQKQKKTKNKQANKQIKNIEKNAGVSLEKRLRDSKCKFTLQQYQSMEKHQSMTLLIILCYVPTEKP